MNIRTLLLILLVTATDGLAQEPNSPIRVVTENTPLTKTTEEEPGSGEATKFVERVLQEADLNYELQVMPWRRGYRLATHTANLLIFPLARSMEREEKFHWVAKLFPASYYLFRLKSRDDLDVASLEEAKAYRIGVVNYSVYHEYLLNRGFANLQPVNSSGQNLKKLLLGRIDFFVTSDSGIFPLCQRTGVDCNLLQPTAMLEGAASGLYLAAGPGSDTAMLHRIKTAYDRLVTQGVHANFFAERVRLLEQFREHWPSL